MRILRTLLSKVRPVTISLGLALVGPDTGQAAGTKVAIPLVNQAPFGNFYVPSLNGYLIRAQPGKPLPTIIILHVCSGLNGLDLKSATAYARHFADTGYATLLLDSFTGRKVGKIGEVCSN